MPIKSLMKNRMIRRFYKKNLEWERNMSHRIALTEAMLVLGIVVCVIINYALLSTSL